MRQETGLTTGTADRNGKLRGARARDRAEVQEGQFAAACHPVLSRADVRSGTRHLDAGCGAGMAAALRGLGPSGGAVRAIEHAGEKAFLSAMRGFPAPFGQADGSDRIGARARCLVATP